jgi:4-oxalocrotonate tautomerase
MEIIKINIDRRDKMPIINMKGPKLSKEQKRELIKRFTEVGSEVTELPKEAFTILLEEVDADNVGVEGEMLSDKQK